MIQTEINISESIFIALKKDFIEGKYKQEDKLPSERELSEYYSVSRITIRDAISYYTRLYDALEMRDINYTSRIIEEELLFGENMIKVELEKTNEVKLR